MNVDAKAAAASREIEHVVRGTPTSDGAGVKLLRVLTQNLQRRLDPFLMLDEFRSDDPGDYIAGFPDHPHRGFETVTYMIAGRMRHRDTTGGEGLLTAGGVQWMTAGRGIVHSELPEQEDGLMHGFQLWLNLPGRDKMTTPGYRDIPAEEIPIARVGGAQVHVVAGRCADVAGAVTRPNTEPLYLDVVLPAGAESMLAIPEGHNAFLYCYDGGVTVGRRGQALAQQTMGILDNAPGAAGVRIAAAGSARVLLIAGRPLNEPIAQWGPFVMNTRAEIERAVEDYRSGSFGR